MQISDEESSIE